MLPLEDPLWDELSCHNISGREFADILVSYYAGDIPSGDDLYEDLLQCICGGDVYDSSFAAAPHLVRLSKSASPDSAAAMLGFAIHAIVEGVTDGTEIDPRLATALPSARAEGLGTAASVFAAVSDDHPHKRYFDAALLGFEGDFEGYQRVMAEIDAQDTEEFERRQQEQNESNNNKRSAFEANLVSEDRDSWTTNVGN